MQLLLPGAHLYTFTDVWCAASECNLFSTDTALGFLTCLNAHVEALAVRLAELH